MPRTPHPMTSISAAMSQLRHALEGLVAEQATMRQQLHSVVQRASTLSDGHVARRGRPPGRMATGGPKKRGRAFKFTDAQAAEFRQQIEGGKSALALAKELKVSLPTMYNTLKRAGWTGRRGRLGSRPSPGARGGPKKRGRAFKFSDEQAGEFRKQVEGGKSAMALAKELKISLPTMYNTLKRAGWKPRRGRPDGRTARAPSAGGAPKKRGRKFKFTEAQAADFRKQVESGKRATALAKELKISLPTMYSTLKRAGWKGRKKL